MTAVDKTPTNPNFLSRGSFKFTLQRAPDLNFFIQKVNLPGISINPVQQPNPFVSIPHSGEHIEYEVLSVTFKVDEDMKNWIAMYNWMIGLGFPDNFGQYNTLKGQEKITQKALESDLSLFVLSSHRNPIFEVIFRNAFPISLSELEFDSTSADVEYHEATVSFKYLSYAINAVT